MLLDQSIYEKDNDIIHVKYYNLSESLIRTSI